MTTTSITSTTASVSNPAITSKDVIEFREANLAMSGTVSTRYKDEAGVGTTIRWSGISAPNSGAARSKSEGNNNTTTKDVTTETAVTLTINNHYYSQFELEEFENSLSIVDQVRWASRGAAYVVNLAVDDALAALPDDFTQTVGTLTIDGSDEDVRRAVQYLDDANAPDDGRWFGMSPAMKYAMLGIDRYASADFNRGSLANIVKGEFGGPYSLRTFTSTNIEGSNSVGHDNTIHQRDAIALAMRMQPKKREFDDISNLSTTYSISAIFGVVETRDDHGVWFKGS